MGIDLFVKKVMHYSTELVNTQMKSTFCFKVEVK